MIDSDDVWVPDACTLRTVEQPLRVREFDDFFTRNLTRMDRISPTLMRWWLSPDALGAAQSLAARETACCAFFRFRFTPSAEAVQVEVEVPNAQVVVLDALAARAAAGMRTR